MEEMYNFFYFHGSITSFGIWNPRLAPLIALGVETGEPIIFPVVYSGYGNP